MSVLVREIEGPRDRKEFIALPVRLHRGRALWVPPLITDEKRYLDSNLNPAFAYSDVTVALAREGKQVVGRVMGIINNRHNALVGEHTARFSQLECENDHTVCHALLGHVESWARGKGMNRVVGPMGFTDQDPQGFIIEGFEHEPTIATYYNHEYLPGLVEREGYRKEVDYVVYRVPVTREIPSVYNAALRRLSRRKDYELLEFRSRRELRRWSRPILELMSETFTGLYGFVPLTPREIDDLTRRFLPILDPRFVKVVNYKGLAVGFVVGMPNIDEGLRKAAGRLFPFGIFHVLRASRRAKQLDLLIGGIRKDHRGLGLVALLGAAMFRSARDRGFAFMDSHHELEDNTAVRSEMERVGGHIYKRYRIYGKTILTLP